jgi:hypothetical protein
MKHESRAVNRLSQIFLVTTLMIMAVSFWPLQSLAQDMIVTRHFSGLWEQPEHENQGFTLHVVHQISGERVAVAFWFTYDANDQPTWFIGQGPVSGDRIDMVLYQVTDVAFLQPNNPDVNSADVVGSLVMIFDSCSNGTAEYDTNVAHIGSGSAAIERYGWILNTHCSGGISDDTPANAPLSEQRIPLLPVNGGNGSGHADFLERPDRTEFSVEAEDLVDGVYDIFVGGIDRGDIVISMGMGETEYRSPVEDGKEPLNFDPRGQVIEVHSSQGAVLSSGDVVFDDRSCDGSCVGDGHEGHHGGNHGGGGQGGGGGQDFGMMDIEVELDNAGVYPLASGDAKLEPRAERTDFSVEIEDVPVGNYELRIGGEIVGTIEAVMMEGTVEGELEFRVPVEPGKLLLDFDPRGKMIEVLEGSTIILNVLFPSS